MGIQMFSEMVEENGMTVRENNLAKRHKYPLGARVKVDVRVEGSSDENRLNRDSCSVTPTLYVVEHTRDCDGTPMYTYGTQPFPPAKGPDDVFAPTYFGREPTYYRNYSEGYHDEVVVETGGKLWSNHRAYWIEQLNSCR